MKRAKVLHRRTLPDGSTIVRVVCPVCDHRHWIPQTAIGHCPRRVGKFVISGGHR